MQQYLMLCAETIKHYKFRIYATIYISTVLPGLREFVTPNFRKYMLEEHILKGGITTVQYSMLLIIIVNVK